MYTLMLFLGRMTSPPVWLCSCRLPRAALRSLPRAARPRGEARAPGGVWGEARNERRTGYAYGEAQAGHTPPIPCIP